MEISVLLSYYLRKARYVEISKHLLAYVCKGFQKEQFLHFHALIFRLSAENNYTNRFWKELCPVY